MQSGYFKSGSASIYYELHGEGEEILVLLHGNGGNCKNFKNQIPFFSKKYKILAIDSRGHGESCGISEIIYFSKSATASFVNCTSFL